MLSCGDACTSSWTCATELAEIAPATVPSVMQIVSPH
jgi:hypothetical protein